MPLTHNPDQHQYEYCAPRGQFLAGWKDRPLTVEQVSAMMDHAYREGFNAGGQVLDRIRQLIQETR